MSMFKDLKDKVMSFKDQPDGYDDDYNDDEYDDEDIEDEDEEEEKSYASVHTSKKSVFNSNNYNNNKSKILSFDHQSSSAKPKNSKGRVFKLSNIQEAKAAAAELMNGAILVVTFDSDKEIATKLLYFMTGVTYAIDARFCRTKDNNNYIFYLRDASIDGNNIADEVDENGNIDLDL